MDGGQSADEHADAADADDDVGSELIVFFLLLLFILRPQVTLKEIDSGEDGKDVPKDYIDRMQLSLLDVRASTSEHDDRFEGMRRWW